MPEPIELYAGFAPPIQVHFATLNDLDSLPAGAGWYAWFQIPDSLSLKSFQLYRHSKLKSSVTGIFNLTFAGRLEATDEGIPPSFVSSIGEHSLETLKSLFLVFAPPLYIGISNTLRTRLKAHRKNLQRFMSSADYIANETINESSIDSDSERESQYFGSRIGLALRTLQLSPDTLYVKCVVADDPSQLKNMEKALNFALTPQYGRR